MQRFYAIMISNVLRVDFDHKGEHVFRGAEIRAEAGLHEGAKDADEEPDGVLLDGASRESDERPCHDESPRRHHQLPKPHLQQQHNTTEHDTS